MSCEFCPGRRDFLAGAARGALAAAALPLAAGCGKSSGAGSKTSSFPTGPTASNGVFLFDFATYPALQNAGGSVQVNLSAASGALPVSVTRVSSTSAAAVSAVCTHSGCIVDAFSSSGSSYTCECHGSVFSASGAVLQGPASTPLTSYTTTIVSNGIQVTAS